MKKHNKEASIRLSSKEKMGLIGNISTMLSAGISIVETIDSLIEDSKGNQRKILAEVKKDLVQGKHLSQSFERFPSVFDKVTVSIIRASESAGTLDITLLDIKKHIQKEMEFSDKVKGALAYPVLIFLVFVGVTMMILLFVMPKMASVFQRMKVTLPLPTKIMVFTSNLLLTKPLQAIAVVGVIVLFFIFIFLKKRSWILGILYAMPLISGLVKAIDLARFSRSMSLLLSSGLTINQALELSVNTLLRKDMRKLVQYSHKMVLSGRPMSEGLKKRKDLVPVLTIKIIEAGEKTGSLDTSLQDVSEYLDYQVDQKLNTLTTMIEPIMLIFVGAVIGGMMLSIITPIYGLIGQVGTR